MDCVFKCVYLDANGECKQGGGECIRDCCPEWLDCNNCKSSEYCDV